MLIINHKDNFKLNIHDYQFNHHAAWLNMTKIWLSFDWFECPGNSWLHTRLHVKPDVLIGCVSNDTQRLMFGKVLDVLKPCSDHPQLLLDQERDALWHRQRSQSHHEASFRNAGDWHQRRREGRRLRGRVSVHRPQRARHRRLQQHRHPPVQYVSSRPITSQLSHLSHFSFNPLTLVVLCRKTFSASSEIWSSEVNGNVWL